MQRCQRFGHTMSLLLIDIDHFKEVNDTFGHQQGDLAILSLVKRISKQLREVDMLGRWGGEEFIVLLPETSSSSPGPVPSGSGSPSNPSTMHLRSS